MKTTASFIAIFIFTISILSTELNAQKLDVSWGTESDLGDKNSTHFPIGWVDGYYYNVRLEYNKMGNNYDAMLEKMSKAMKVVSVVPLKYESSYNVNFEYFHYTDGTIFLFSSTYERSEDAQKVYCETFDLIGKKIKTHQIAKIRLDKKGNYSPLQFSSSRDQSKLVAMHGVGRKKDEPFRHQIITITLDNPSNSQLFEHSIDFSGDEIGIEDLQVDNQGRLVYVIKEVVDKKEPSNSYLVVYKNNSVSDKIALEYEDKVLDNFSIVSDLDDNLKLSGLYLEKEKRKSFYKGFFLTSFSFEENTLKGFHAKPFSSKLIAKFGKRAAKKGEANIRGEYQVEMYPNEKGGGFLVAENLNIYAKSGNVYHNYKEILVVGYSSTGELTHMNLLPKYQVNSYTQPQTSIGFVSFTFAVPYGFLKLMELYTSYSAFVEQGQLYLIFNDEEKNNGVRTQDDVKAMNFPNKEITRLYTVDSEGKLKSKVFFDNKEEGGFFVTSKTYTEEKPYVIGLMKRKTVRYGKLEFN